MPIIAGQIVFYYLAAASVASAILAVTRKNPVHSMLWVLALFLHVAGIFLLVGAEFLAAVQIIVYAGAILVFYLFFLMLLDLPGEEAVAPVRRALAARGGRRARLRGPDLVRGRLRAGAVSRAPSPVRRRPGNLSEVGTALFGSSHCPSKSPAWCFWPPSWARWSSPGGRPP